MNAKTYLSVTNIILGAINVALGVANGRSAAVIVGLAVATVGLTGLERRGEKST